MTSRRRVVTVVVVAVLGLVAGLAGQLLLSSGSATSRIKASPPPPLFSATQVAPTRRSIAAQQTRASRLLAVWVRVHGTTRDDAAFVRWVEGAFPAPPAALGDQLGEVDRLAATRTAAGVRAATWLEKFGKKDLWKLAAHDQGELLAAPARSARKDDEKALLSLGKQVSDALGARFASSAPYVREPSLRPDHRVTRGQVCPCSYPSRHATAAAASRTFLGGLFPTRLADYRETEAQVDFSRVYMAGHFPGDITAGAELGDLVGGYFLITRGGARPAEVLAAG